MSVDRSGGAYNGNIYIVWTDQRSGDPNILLVKSTNNGSTWLGTNNVRIDQGGTPVRVNQDQTTRDQWFPCITVDPAGIINVVYYDSRSDPNNQLAEVWISRSYDGGATFNDFKTGDYQFMPIPIYSWTTFGSIGDHISMVATPGVTLSSWMDNRVTVNGKNVYQAFVDHNSTIPTLSWPGDGDPVYAVPRFLWSASTGASTYRIQVADNSNFTNPVVNCSAITGTSYQPSSLNGPTTYYWHINASYPCGTGVWSNSRQFQTSPPPAPQQPSPPNCSTTSVSPTLSWYSPGATVYSLQVADNNNFTNPVISNNGITSNSYQLSNLNGTTPVQRHPI